MHLEWSGAMWKIMCFWCFFGHVTCLKWSFSCVPRWLESASHPLSSYQEECPRVISSLLGNPAGSSGKSIWERLGDVKVGPFDGNLTQFMIRRRWTRTNGSLRVYGHKTWLEELASESNTTQAQEDLSVSRKIAGKIKVKLFMNLWRFSSISQDWSIRLSPRLVWYQILSIRFLGIQRGHQENPYEKDWAASRSVHLMEIWHNSWLEDVRYA